MAVIGFQQDPGAPEGAGMFQLDDGRSLYAHDPELARSLGPDMRQASNGFRTTDQRLDAGGPAPGLDDQLNQVPNANQFQAPPAAAKAIATREAEAQPQPAGPAAPPADVMQPATPTGGGPTERDQNVSRWLKSEATKTSAPRAEAWVPKSRAETVETEGMPYSPEDAAVRIAANRQVIEAKAATAELLRQRAVNDMASAKAAQPALLQKAAEAQKELDAQHAAYAQDRAQLQKAIDDSNSAGGASDWFANKSSLAKAAIVLGQAFGAYAATLSGGENWAAKQLNQIMEHDIAAQKEAAKRGVDNAYKQLELHYRDKDQAEAALRLAQANVMQNMQNMHASANQAEDVQAAHQEWTAQNRANMVASEQKFQNASYGKHTIKTDIAHQPASGGGGADIVAIAKKLKSMGFSDEEVKQYIFGQGGRQRGDAIDRANVAHIDGQAREFTTPDARKRAEETVPELNGMQQKAEELKSILRSGAIDPRMRARAKALSDQLAIAYGPAFSGSKRVNEYEINAGKDTFGHLSDSILSGSTTDMLGRSQAAIDTVLEHVKARKAELLEGSYRVTPALGTDEQGRRARQYQYQTAPETMEDVQ